MWFGNIGESTTVHYKGEYHGSKIYSAPNKNTNMFNTGIIGKTIK